MIRSAAIAMCLLVGLTSFCQLSWAKDAQFSDEDNMRVKALEYPDSLGCTFIVGTKWAKEVDASGKWIPPTKDDLRHEKETFKKHGWLGGSDNPDFDLLFEEFCKKCEEKVIAVKDLPVEKYAYRKGCTDDIDYIRVDRVLPSNETIHVFIYGNGYVAKVCGNFSNPNTCEITVCKYNDRNLNGVFDQGEGIPNWAFKIDDRDTIYHTGQDGCLTVRGLYGVTYTVREWDEENGSPITPDAEGNFTLRGKRWRALGDVARTVECPGRLEFGNVCLGSITACKLSDADMDGVKDPTEQYLAGWPVRLTGTLANGSAVTPVQALTGPSGCHTFDDLLPGAYTVTESGAGLAWEKVVVQCGSTAYCDWKTTGELLGTKWLFTGVRIDSGNPQTDACALSGSAPGAKVQVDCSDHNITFANVCLADVTACKFHDCDMDGVKDPDESMLEGWPMTLAGTRVNGRQICPDAKLTGAGGCVVFRDLAPGDYAVSEEGFGIQWELHTTTCGAVSYKDLRTTWQGQRWQSTRPRPGDADSVPLPSQTPAPAPAHSLQVTCANQSVLFGNVQLSKVRAFKFHDLNMNGVFEPLEEPWDDLDGNGVWTPAEPLGDENCNGVWDQGEYFYDQNKNDVWDPAEPFSDLDGDGQYDWPECVLPTWPFALDGARADGLPVCAKASTDETGWTVFEDVAPSDPAGYTLSEDLDWCSVHIGWPEPVLRATHLVSGICTGLGPCGEVDRWQATSTVRRTFVLPCSQDHSEMFSNVCLTRLDGMKEVYDDGMPGDVDGKPGKDWKICLAGTDHYGRDIVPSTGICVPAQQAGSPPIIIPCINPLWYETTTGSDGRFSFVDLLPGHYHLAEQPHPDYRLDMDRPMLSGFDVMCCPQTTLMRNIRKGLAWKVYQVYPGSSCGAQEFDAGYLGSWGDPVVAVPGILCIEPGREWWNYRQCAELCRSGPLKNVTLRKSLPELGQCYDVFSSGPNYPGFSQHGTPNVRLWWPLMYDPPGTSWTLKIIYGTRSAVRFPGESAPGYIHSDEWKWVVDTDIGRVKLFLGLARQLPFGLCEVPLLSNELVYRDLIAKLEEVEALVAAGKTVAAGNALIDFEMMVEDLCTTICPDNAPAGFAGIVNTSENPVCCKLLADAEYIGRKLGILIPAK